MITHHHLSRRIALGTLIFFAAVGVSLVMNTNTEAVMGSEADLANDMEFHPNRILVKYREDATELSILGLNDQLRTKRLRTLKRIGVEVIKLPEGSDIPDMIARFMEHPDVEYAEPDYVVHATLTPNDFDYPDLWGLNNTGQAGGLPDADVDAPEAWDIQTGSPTVIVSSIDTGADYDHPDLEDNIWVNPGEDLNNNGVVDPTDFDGIDTDGNGYVDDIRGWNFVSNNNDPDDDNGHGSHTIGTIGAVGNNGIGVTGVNWTVSIMPLKFLNRFGSGFTSDAIDAINYATDFGVPISNNSWGGGGFSQSLKNAIAACTCLFVAASGNNSVDTDVSPHYPSAYDLDRIVAVTATDRFDNWATFANWGLISVDIGAPGVDILSLFRNNGYTSLDGTSMAAPHVAGAAALLLAEDPTLTSDEIKDRLLSTVDPIPDLIGYTVSGGRLNIASALSGAPPASDVVDIRRALWLSTRNRLVVMATSSEGGNVTLTAQGYGNLVYITSRGIHRGIFPNVTSNPGTVTVTSSGGGSDTASVITR